MAKAVALIAFALGVLAIAGNVQGYTFIKAEDVDPTNKPMIQSIKEVVCATCKLNSKTDFEELKKAELEIKCRSRKNGTVTYIQTMFTDNGGFYRTWVEDGHKDDLCMVRVVASPNPRCNAKVPGFRSAGIALVNFSDNTTVYVEKQVGFMKNEALPNCRKVRSKRGNLIPAITRA
ncbi:hypothetical protein RHMOL_Rhmol04G0043400 [Rhododendron molle]|uniref:Uncharacterized protein n=1 Tax=Rhododendron molle TaxID=49168 RepID=A0ACC0NWZ0_RHOML|nr:hypothetical protein RHMOL_Rhmol04G0043400 [Rhododendron molle]